MKADAALTKLRKAVASLPDVSEGAHAGAIAFKSGGKMFATYRDGEIVFALEQDAMDALLDADPRFKKYPRAPAIVIRASDIRDWAQMTDLLAESCKLVAKPRKRK